MKSFRNLFTGVALTGATLLSQATLAAPANLDVAIQTVSDEATTVRGVFEKHPDMQFLMVDIGNWSCQFCRQFADQLVTNAGWIHVFSTPKCGKIAVIGDNAKAWADKYGPDHTYKGSISKVISALNPDGGYSEYPIMLFIDRDGNVLSGSQRTPSQAFVDVVESKCNS